MAEFPPPQDQPNSKRQKMPSTPTSDHQDNGAPNPKYKRRKIAIFFAYCGVGYQGMQKNPGAKTIEADLEEALYHSGAVPEADRGIPKRFDWARSARTDKGVSAVGQVVSGCFYIDPPGFLERLNSHLPPQIRVFGYKRVTPSFSAKKFCDRRRYVYLIPVFALDPSCHRDRKTVLASKGSEHELVNCIECSERGRKVLGVMGKGSGVGTLEVGPGIISSNSEGAFSGEKTDLISSETSEEGKRDTKSDSNMKGVPGDEQRCEKGTNGSSELENDNHKEDSSNGCSPSFLDESNQFWYRDDIKERFNRILNNYQGTHNFHNFTTRTKAEDPSAKRYIISFNANSVVSVDGMDFVKCVVVGQSFMLHQIRKMIGLAVAIMRNFCPESLLETAFQQKVNITVPMAPEVGLYLEECMFSSYNQKWKDSHEELSMEAYSEEAEDFKLKYIYSHIVAAEHKDGAVGLWLHSLNHRNYPDLVAPLSNNPNPVQPICEGVDD